MKKIYVILAVVALLSTTACGWTKETLGMAKTGPDETLVQTNRPLILPPEYDARPNKVLIKSQDNDEDDGSASENE